jgi:CelD/BcsL family acetyltransferase involved in cellulose biosynthesis
LSASEVRILRTIVELDGLAAEWAGLAARFGTPLQDHDWLACAAHSLHREEDLRIVTVREHGLLTAVAPMALSKTQKHLVLLGSPALYEPGEWLHSSMSGLRHLAAALVEIGHAIVLDRVPARSAACELLPQMLRWQAVMIKRPTAESCTVPTKAPWEAYCATLLSRTRRKFAAARARAERERGRVDICHTAPAPHEACQAVALFAGVEAGGWKARGGTALSTRPDLLRFFQRYATHAATLGRLRLAILRIDGVPAAVELGVQAYGRMWQLKVAYDEQFAAYSPGLLLVHSSIGATNAAGLEAYEFLGSAERWQEQWRPQRRRYELAAIYPLSANAIATAFDDVTSHLWRKMQRPPQAEEVLA